MDKIPVYFMPGLAASSKIFERIQLDPKIYEVCYLEWDIPFPNESLNAYCVRYLRNHIHHENPIMIGVSMGGIIVQEIATIIAVKKTIIISSVKSNQEFPRRIRWGNKIKLNRLIPTGWVKYLYQIEQLSLPKKIKARLQMYQMYLSVNDKVYLDWAFKQIFEWSRILPDKNVVHIHGEKDGVFPMRYIAKDSCLIVPSGTHIMILNKSSWLNENLPQIIS